MKKITLLIFVLFSSVFLPTKKEELKDQEREVIKIFNFTYVNPINYNSEKKDTMIFKKNQQFNFIDFELGEVLLEREKKSNVLKRVKN